MTGLLVFLVSSVCIIIVPEHFHGQRKKITETTLKVNKNIYNLTVT